MATLKMLARSLCSGNFVVYLDLSDAYFHIRIDPAFCRFLRFQFQGTFFQFQAMPFGLSSAPRTLSKLTWPITLFCRHLGIRIIFYLDDSIIMARSRQFLLKHRDLVLSLLNRLDLLVNFSKSDLSPSQNFTFLGLQWVTLTSQVSLPLEKQTKIQRAASRLVARP